MTDNQSIKLPFLETIKRSFVYFFKNINAYTKLASLGIVVVLFDMFTNFPTLCSMRGVDCSGNWAQTVSTLLLLIISVAIIILYTRNIVLKSINMGQVAFIKAVAYYILFSILFVIAIALPSMGVMFVYGMATAGSVHPLLDRLILLVPLVLVVLLSPWFLIFPSIAVEDKSFGLRNVFAKVKGNCNAIFWGQFVMMLPCGILIYLLNVAYQLLGIDNYLVNELFIILVIAVSLIDSCLKASFFAHVYQYFKFYDKKD